MQATISIELERASDKGSGGKQHGGDEGTIISRGFQKHVFVWCFPIFVI
jgi:hypothetical protein